MIYHYHPDKATIHTTQTTHTKPITNEVYNIIIQEAQEIPAIDIEYYSYGTTTYLKITHHHAIIRFYLEYIHIVYSTDQDAVIPYEHYTNLKELLSI